MPLYEYECPDCYRRVTEMKPVKERDDSPDCAYCFGRVSTTRVITSGTFKINGFSEANGYSKCNGDKT